MRTFKQILRDLPRGKEMEQLWNELPSLTDGTAALMVSAWLDRHLEDAIKLSFVKSVEDDELHEIFSFSGPLETSGAKLRMAFALGIFGKKTKDGLNKLQKIRNLFAHSPVYLDFDKPEIKAACCELKISEYYNSFPGMERLSMKPTGLSAREQFMDACSSLLIGLLFYQEQVSNSRDPQTAVLSDAKTGGSRKLANTVAAYNAGNRPFLP